MTRKQYQRGQVVCKEGTDSEHLYIICKGEFEVSKVIDVSLEDKIIAEKSKKTNQQYLPKKKLVQITGNLLT